MKFARDCRSSESNEATAQLLFEALSWIKNLTGKTVVIKYGQINSTVEITVNTTPDSIYTNSQAICNGFVCFGFRLP